MLPLLTAAPSWPWSSPPPAPPPATLASALSSLVADAPTTAAEWALLVLAVCLAAVVGDYVLDLVSTVLNLSALTPSMPAEFKAIYKDDDYAKSQAYTKAKAKYAIVKKSFDLVVFILFWLYLNGFALADDWVRASFDGVVARGLAYIWGLQLVTSAMDLPWAVYHTFVLEESFGFNKTTAKTFVLDRVKGLALMLAIGMPVLSAVLWMLDYLGDLAWLYVWAFVASVQLVMVFIAPVLILPLFNKFEPLPDGELKDAIDDYAAKMAFKYEGIYSMDGSKRSAHSNAFFTGFGKFKRIALFDTLIKQTSTEELVAVLAHEIGHSKKGHITMSIAIQFAYMFVLFLGLSLCLGWEPLFLAFDIATPSVYVGLMLFSLLFSPIDTFLQIALNVRSRANEFEADRYSVETYKKPEALVAALKTLSKENLANLTPHPFYVFLNYSHPPMLARVAAIRAHARR